MVPLADTHVHLLAGLDDGPPTDAVAHAMCRMLVAEGTAHATALAHQNEDYPANTPGRLLAAAAKLHAELAGEGVPLAVHPAAEVMLSPSLVADWRGGRLLSIANRRQWLLVEMPYVGFVDVLPYVEALRADGLRLVIAHAERYPELLHDPVLAERLIAAGCLLQVTARAVAEPWDDDMERGVRHWLTHGFVHLLGSDGHGIERRQPRLAAGYRALEKLAGRAAARHIGSVWGTAVLRGEPVSVPPPHPPRRSWFTRLFGG
ncbi:MAG: protein tyrosine phosphatase [Gemmataceae bacterium]|nr:protein tyrosine phosphatase [Gemmataceae bacterium]